MEASLIGFVLLMVLILIRLPLAIAMGMVGVGGFAWMQMVGYGNPRGLDAALNMIASVAFDTGLAYGLSVVPLFLLMGNLITESGMSKELYRAANAFLGHFKGGLALATVVSCGAFSAVCGSSMATAATMSKVALPSMREYRYSDGLATGAIAAGGTLGILIPPSVILVIYGLMTESDIGKLFIAGLIPGLIGVLMYMAAVAFAVRINPQSGPAGPRSSWRERLQAMKGVWGINLIFIIVMGGIYAGIFTPTEAAGIGASGAFLIALFSGRLNFMMARRALSNAARTTAMLFFLVIGAVIFSNFINLTGLPVIMRDWVLAQGVSPMLVILMLIGVYLLLGCVLESMSMILLTVPVFYPMVEALGFDLIWFGILVVVVTEISLITPPVGMNVFVLRGVVPDVKLSTIFKGVTPFWCADILRLLLIATVPSLSLMLPRAIG
ncbi:C4-dicarboxylate ABC transporter permease [Marinobacterium zhoushanense]|uniref:TRAP transporter large permease protein n=2 Tax=Marinobacterium TaxID=48075 RepID=A0A081FZH4_9GAMM|nr:MULTISPECIES: TRAP transporter large permease [Marinobacterium]KEA63929.1 TRAP dicarboxylate transporter, DctM subunit, unknown substrate 3 [Marinobacterium lacunae]GGB84692.1 C4-dicarboxylate ABC transporter permease [Marinobacterium zhoushanense]